MLENLIFIPAKITDLDDIYELVLTSETGLTSLPKNKKSIRTYIDESIDSMYSNNSCLFSNRFLFVLKDISINKVIGISAIASSISRGNSFYAFKFNKIFDKNSQLDLTLSNLQLEKLSPKWSELCSLYLHPSYRFAGIGRFLSVARFLFITQHPNLFRNSIIAELRGVSTNLEGSVFWNTVMKPVFKTSFSNALKRVSKGIKFDFSLFGTNPIFLNTLPNNLIDVLGQCHFKTRGAHTILSSESFQSNGYIDVFDGGPKLTVSRDQLHSLQRIKLLEDFSVAEISDHKEMMLVSSGQDRSFNVQCVYACEQKNKNALIFDCSSHFRTILSNGQLRYYMRLFPLSTIMNFKSQLVKIGSVNRTHSKFIHSFSDWYRHTRKKSKNRFYK
jgi:arginine N-succinyltransferase